MRWSMSGFDIRRMVSEMQVLVGGFLQKAYHPGYKTLLFNFNAPATEGERSYEKLEVLIELGKWMNYGSFDIETPKVPSTFAMTLRKYLSNSRLLKLEQYGMDRILVFTFSSKEGDVDLIVEMFGDGNAILVKDGHIIQPLHSKSWSLRDIKAKKEFQFPQPRLDPTTADKEDMRAVIARSEKDLVRTLFGEVNLPPKIAEDICYRMKMDKNAPAVETTPDELTKIIDEIYLMRDELAKGNGGLVYVKNVDDELEAVALSPITLHQLSDLTKQEHSSFSQALNEFLALMEEEEEEVEVVDPEVRRLERQIESQEETLAKFKVDEEKNRMIGDAIYANFPLCEQVLSNLLKAKEEFGWKEVEARASKIDVIKQLNSHDGYVVIPLKVEGMDDGGKKGDEDGGKKGDEDGGKKGDEDGGKKGDEDGGEKGGRAEASEVLDVKLDLTKDVNQNAASYYEKGRKAKEKGKGAVAALEESKALLKKAEKHALKKIEKKKTAPTKRFWFDRFRWFITTAGNLVISGRDAGTNDRVVKKHLKSGDKYAHADMHGAPSVVVKREGQEEISEEALEEACHFALIFSKAWPANFGQGSAYWVNDEQVSKTPVSGEYLARGAFIVRGRRNIVDGILLRCAVGEIEYQGERKIMGGPVDPVKARAKKYFVLIPGKTKRTDAAKQMAKEFSVPVDDVMAALPPGDVEIIEKHGIDS